MNQLLLDRKISKHPEVCASCVDNELILMGPEDNIYYRINATGMMIWNFMESNSRTVNELVAYITNYYAVEESLVLKGVHGFIVLMLEKKIMRYV